MNDDLWEEDRLSVFLQSFGLEHSPLLDDIRRQALEEQVPILRMETARLLRFLMQTLRPKHILEVGCAVGYSSLWMLESLSDPEACITTIENYEKRIVQAKENLRRAHAQERITLLEGDATVHLAQLKAQTFDFVFMDAAKAQYITWLEQVLRVMKTGGVLVTDNILQEGELLESRFVVTRRDRTIHSRMREYVRVLMTTEGLETILLPVGDGVTLTYKKNEKISLKTGE